MPELVSRGRREVTEITHIAPVRAGLVPGIEARITYADRLRVILDAFHQREDQGFPSVIRIFSGIHCAQWTLFDGDTRLLLNVVFDGDWKDYLRALAYEVPGFLNLIWSNCEGWEPVDNNPERLLSYISRFQERVNFFYAHHFDLSVRDVQWLKALRTAFWSSQTPPEHRAALLAQIQGATTPLAPEKLRDSLLAEYDAAHAVPPHSAVEKAKQQLLKGLGKLYKPEELNAAINEGFGPAQGGQR